MNRFAVVVTTAVFMWGAGATATLKVAKGPFPVATPPQVHDLSIRFAHLEPRTEAADLTAFWPFDEGSGYSFRDASRGKHPAYLTGHTWNTTDSGLSAATHRQGRRGGAVYLNGRQWLQARAAPDLQHPEALTLSAWLKPDGDPAGRTVVSNMAGRQGYALRLGPGGTLEFRVGDGVGRLRRVSTRAGAVRAGAWVHVLATSDPGSGQLRLYVNGALAGRSGGAPFTPGRAEGDLRIGAAADGGGTFRGWLDEVALHARALSPREARTLYAVGFPKLYLQTRETLDAERTRWTAYKGGAPVPHPAEADTVFLAPFDGTLRSVQGHAPLGKEHPENLLAPGRFGGALDATVGGLRYPSPIRTERGTAEVWFIPAGAALDREGVLLRAEGEGGWLELLSSGGTWAARLGRGEEVLVSAVSPQRASLPGVPVHVGATWRKAGQGEAALVLYLNGVPAARATGEAGDLRFDRALYLGGAREGRRAHGVIDDVRVSGTVKGWGEVGPRGHVVTEAASLDLRDGFDRQPGEPLWLWRGGNTWRYAHKAWEDGGHVLGDSGTLRRSLEQAAPVGLRTLVHPDAYGEMSSAEAGVSFGRAQNGWAGVFLHAPGSAETFSGHTFTVNPGTDELRLATFRDGAVVASKTLPYDFALEPRETYTLTLTALNDGVLRGYLDGHNLISWSLPEGSPTGGYAGLVTEDAAAHFDDVHVSALTPGGAASRRVQSRLFAGGGGAAGYRALELSAFRWAKRHGLLPWRRTSKDPEPPGAIFGADNGTVRPNPPQPWRSHDAANSEVVLADGTVHYFMRGNPHLSGTHGPAAIGVLTADGETFDGLHFNDLSAGAKTLEEAALLRGHRDPAPPAARDDPPRDERLQLNDQSSVLLGDKLLVMAREFRNSQLGYPWFRRLVFGLFDPETGRWQTEVGRPVAWSGPADPADPFSPHRGIDATPEMTTLRDPETDAYTVFLFHHAETPEAIPATGVTGLRLARGQLVLHEGYPTRVAYTKRDVDAIYGERILFDNGIYYLHVNAGADFDFSKLEGDWPDRFQLASSLHPYRQPFVRSSASNETYFTRGGENSFDNAAVWQGTMFKHRGRYYLFYETYHAIRDVDRPYEFYDDLETGSRVGYATAN